MKTATQRSFIAFFAFKQEDSQSAIALHTSGMRTTNRRVSIDIYCSYCPAKSLRHAYEI